MLQEIWHTQTHMHTVHRTMKLVLQLLKTDLERCYFYRVHVGQDVGRFGLLLLFPDWCHMISFLLCQSALSFINSTANTTQYKGQDNHNLVSRGNDSVREHIQYITTAEKYPPRICFSLMLISLQEFVMHLMQCHFFVNPFFFRLPHLPLVVVFISSFPRMALAPEDTCGFVAFHQKWKGRHIKIVNGSGKLKIQPGGRT